MIEQFSNYLKYERNFSNHTVISYTNDCREFEEFILREGFSDNIINVKRDRIARNYISYLHDQNLTSKTIARKVASLRHLYSYLLENNYVKTNIFDKVNTPKISKKLPEVISDDIIEKLLSSIDTTTNLGLRNYIMLDLLYSSGLRASELTSLTINDVYTNQSQILVMGKGSIERYVPIHNVLIKNIRTYLTNDRIKLIKNNETNALFLNYRGEPLTTRGLRLVLNSLIKESGRHHKLHPHMLRHAFATTLLNNGADLRVVQELLGHKHLKSTQIYTKVSHETLRAKFDEAHPRKGKDDEGIK